MTTVKKVSLADVLAMPVAERILFVEDVWDSIAASPEAVTLTDAQREELDRRLEEYHRAPREGSPWDVVKARVRRS
jgi:putative addiction module component (TIGR02574 family)